MVKLTVKVSDVPMEYPDQLMEDILQEIRNERARQDAKWGSQRHLPPYTWMTILMEEVGESARASLEGDPVGYGDELVQVAAVAVAALESHYAQQDARPIVEDECPDASVVVSQAAVDLVNEQWEEAGREAAKAQN